MRRRERLSAFGREIREALEILLGAPPLASSWLRQVVDEPRSAEADALKVWNSLVEDCDVPDTFRVPGRTTLSLGELLRLRTGKWQHRQMFAEQQPWAARQLLADSDQRGARKALTSLSRPSNSIKVAAMYLCCDHGPCEMAMRFARHMPRHRKNVAVDRLLGGNTAADRRLRSLLMDAYEQDGGELLAHIGDRVALARRQIARAIEVLDAYRREVAGGFHSAFAVAVLLIRVMVREGVEPNDLDPRIIVLGLTALSADCLAAFAADRRLETGVGVPMSEADHIDRGVLAFLTFVGRPRRPRLTAKQLIRLTQEASRRGVHQTVQARLKASDWPPPLGWSPDGEFGGARVRHLASLDALSAEGKEMENCLREGFFDKRAALGEVALFSIQVGADRATLALQPSETRIGVQLWLTGWRMIEFRGKANREPSAACRRVGDLVAAGLNENCPVEVPDAEIKRREAVFAAFNSSRSFNKDLGNANERWRETYARLLPRSLASASPAAIVDEYLGTAL